MTIPEVFYPFHFWWSFSYFLAWGYCKQLWSHRVCISSTFLDDGKLFFKVLVPIHMVTSSDREFQLFHIFTSASSILPKCALCIWKVQLCLAVVFICVFFLFSNEVDSFIYNHLGLDFFFCESSGYLSLLFKKILSTTSLPVTKFFPHFKLSFLLYGIRSC